MKKKGFMIILALCLVSAMTLGVTYAAFNAKKETTNRITIGNIDVELIDIYTRPENVAPGDVVPKIVSAKNTGNNDAYVRINLNKIWTNSGEINTDLDTDLIEINFPNPKDWIYGGDGYYYYQKPLHPGERASDLIDSFKLSLNYKAEDIKELEGKIVVNAEAIQYDNFTPDIVDGSIVGWKDIKIDNSENYEGIYDNEVVRNEISNVYFQNDAYEFITLPDDDLFLNFKGVMPGDNITQKIEVANKNKETIHLYMYAAETPLEKFTSQDTKDISDKLIESCTIDVIATYPDGTSKNLYTGPVKGQSEHQDMTVLNSIYLGRFEKDNSAEISVNLHVPKEWNIGNAEGKIDWIFTCANEEKPNVTPEPPRIKTGDNNNTKLYVGLAVLLIASGGVMLGIVMKRRSKYR